MLDEAEKLARAIDDIRQQTELALGESFVETQAEYLARALLAVLPVVKAAEEWADCECERLAGCEYGEHDNDCPVLGTLRPLFDSVAKMREVLK